MTAITTEYPEGAHIPLTCRNHPNLRWFTKNIDFIGARNVFYDGDAFTKNAPQECDCPMSDLVVVPDETKGEKK